MRSLSGHDLQKLQTTLSLLNPESQPNINALTEIVKNIPLMSLTFKMFGYDLARDLASALPPLVETAPSHVGLTCKPSTQADIESDWVRHWCHQLHAPVVYHRKLWELSYVLQAIFENGHLAPGAKGLGFGCGIEPIPSYLAARGVDVTMTDLLPEAAAAKGWTATNQHSKDVESAFQAHLVERSVFDEHVSLQYIDMNAIPAALAGYDFCWSVCALEHLGSIDHGMAFIENSLTTIKPGGLSVHTTEININGDGETIDNWPTVLFQKKHFEALGAKLTARGHDVAAFDFFMGDKPMDRFIDLPPYHHDLPQDFASWVGAPQHLKLGIDGFASTCFGFLVRKAA